MCNAFSDIVDLTAESEEKCKEVMNFIHILKENLQKNGGACGINQPTPNLITSTNYGCIANVISKEAQSILTPVAVRSKGRPPFKRKQSKMEQIVRKKNEKKKMMITHGNLSNEEREKKVRISCVC